MRPSLEMFTISFPSRHTYVLSSYNNWNFFFLRFIYFRYTYTFPAT